MLRLVASLASLLVAFHAFVPLALACCDAPPARSCCAQSPGVEGQAAPQLDKVPCCRAGTAPQADRKDEAVGPQIRAPDLSLSIVLVRLALAVPKCLLRSSGARTLYSVQPLRPPLPLRI